MEFMDNRDKIYYYVKRFRLKEFFRPDYYPEYLKYMSLVKFSKGEYIYKQKENIQYIYFFVEGRIKVYSLLSNGKRQLLYFYTKFGILGDLELFNRSNPYTLIQAAQDSYCIALPLADTKQLLYNDPIFLRQMAELLAQKLCNSSSNSSLNIYYSLENRLCAYILASAEKGLEQENEILIFKEGLSETAEILGTSYRHLHRTLKELKEKGILEKGKGGYRVLDPDQLMRLSSDQYM
jgi:CRP-like cAMP-binding protein